MCRNKINAHQHTKIVKIKVLMYFRPSSTSTESLEYEYCTQKSVLKYECGTRVILHHQLLIFNSLFGEIEVNKEYPTAYHCFGCFWKSPRSFGSSGQSREEISKTGNTLYRNAPSFWVLQGFLGKFRTRRDSVCRLVTRILVRRKPKSESFDVIWT